MISPSLETRLMDFYREVYAPIRLVGKSQCNRVQIEVAISQLGKFIGHDPTFTDLNDETFASFVQWHLDRKLSIVTAIKRVKHLQTQARFAKLRRVPIDDTVFSYVLPRAPRRCPRAWLPEEMDRLLQSAKLARGRCCGIEFGKWWTALILLLYDTGLRLNAAFQVRFDELDFTTRMLLIPPERMKNAVEQYFRLSDQTIAAILETIPPKRARIFPWPFRHHRALYDRLRVILRRAGLPHTKKDLFHKLRRTTASEIARVAGEHAAIRQLGHRNPSTIHSYVDPRFTAKHDMALWLPRPDAPFIPVTEIEVKDPLPVDAEKEKVVKSFSLTAAQLAGSGRDIIADLSDKDIWTGDDVRDLLDALGMFQADLAKEIGVSEQWLCSCIKGRNPVTGRVAQRIKSRLGFVDARNGEAGAARGDS